MITQKHRSMLEVLGALDTPAVDGHMPDGDAYTVIIDRPGRREAVTLGSAVRIAQALRLHTVITSRRGTA